MTAPESVDRDLGRRHLPVAGFIMLAVVWLVIIKLSGTVVNGKADVTDGRLLTPHNLVWAMVLPLGIACLFVYAAIGVLGWWHPLLYDPRPVNRWVWCIPIIFAVAIIAGINYGGLADRGLGFTLTLLLVAMLVGFGEEGMFRCIGVTSLRQHGLTEVKVALWSSVTFGLVHVTNVIGGDSRAFAQAIIVSFAGYFFYLIRRVSRSNILNSLLHGMFDFMIITCTQIIPPGEKAYPGAIFGILVYVLCGIILVVRRHHIEPVAPTLSPAAVT